MILVAGDAGVGKSTLNLAEAMHVALGRPFLDHPTVKTRVLYFDEENSKPDLLAYLQALWIGLDSPPELLTASWLRIEHFSLGHKTWPSLMESIMREHRPGLIYIDTAGSAFDTDDEDKNAEAQRMMRLLRRIMSATNHPAIKILKHAKFQTGGGQKGGPTRRTIRGAKSWLGGVDQVVYHIRRPGRPRQGGLSETVLVPDKTRAYGLQLNTRVIPSYTDTTPKGLIFKGETLLSKDDLMIVT